MQDASCIHKLPQTVRLRTFLQQIEISSAVFVIHLREICILTSALDFQFFQENFRYIF